MLNLILETTTGLLVPAGVAPQIPRGPVAATLQLVTNGNAALLPEGQPVSLVIYAPTDLVTPLATFAAWTRNTSFQLYQAQLNPLTTDLGWSALQTLVGRISYGAPNVDSPLFQVVFGGSGSGAGAVPQIVITQPAGPVLQTVVIGSITGKLTLDQEDGSHEILAAAQVTGLQLTANTAPVGSAAWIELVKNGVPTGKVATLAAAAKAQITAFDPPEAVAPGDILSFKVAQIGSTKPGGYLTVSAQLQLT